MEKGKSDKYALFCNYLLYKELVSQILLWELLSQFSWLQIHSASTDTIPAEEEHIVEEGKRRLRHYK